MAFTFQVKVVPSSGKNTVIRDKSGQLKWYLKSAPEKGRANAELIKSIAQALKIPQNVVSIIAGATARKKTIKVAVDYDFDTVLQLLGVEGKQMTFM